KLTYGDYKIPGFVHQKPVHVNAHGKIQLSMRDLQDQGSRHFAQWTDALAPVMRVKERGWNTGEHADYFRRRHRGVGGDGGQDGDGRLILELFVKAACEESGPRMQARDVGR